MSFATAMMTPLALLLPAPAGVDIPQGPWFEVGPASGPQQYPQVEHATPEPAATSEFAGWTLHLATQDFEPKPAHQVRIEQRMTIRITPQSQTTQRSVVVELPDRAIGPRFVERKIGKCVKVAHISGVQTDVGNRLLLFMNDRRIISAMLERACRARDFYSGFYLSKSDDGKLCVARDTLQSRSGANCKLTQLRQLVEVGD